MAAADPVFVTTWAYVILLPGVTGFGEAELLMERSACAVTPTTVFTVALLLAAFGSAIAELTLAESLMTVPFGVPGFTRTTTVNIAVVAAGMSAIEHTKVPVPPGTLHAHPAGGVVDTSVVLAGIVSTNETLVASLGPLLVTVCVYVMLAPAATGFGAPAFAMPRSELELTWATSVKLSLAKLTSPPPETVAVLASVPGAFWLTVALMVMAG